MCHTTKAIIFGLCSALAACSQDPTAIPAEPEAVMAEAGAATQSTNPLQASNTWATKRSLRPWRHKAAAGAINGVIYVVGGRGRDGATFGRVDAYRIETNTWSLKALMPSARSDPNGASVIGGKLYVSGGYDNQGRPTKTLFVYNPGTNTWTRKADMPRAGCGGGEQGVIGGQLYVYNGCFADRHMGEVFYRYNPSTNTWVKLPAPPADHALGGGAAIGGKFYLNGGFTSSCGGTCGGNTHNLDVYNPATNTWTTKPGRGSTATTAGALNGKLYILGGFGDTYNRTVDAYDPITNTWTSRAPLPEGSALGMAVGAMGKLYYIEGETSWFAERPSMVYAYTP